MLPTARRTPVDALAASVAMLVPIAFTSVATSPSWVPKSAVLLVALPFGLVLFARLLLSPGRGAPVVAAGAFVMAATISTVLSDVPHLAFFGAYGAGTGLLFVLTLVAMWAIGHSTSQEGRRLTERALVLGVTVNAALAVAQVVTDLDRFGLALLDARSAGLMGNPVHLAGLLVGALGLAGLRFLEAPRRWAAPVAICALAVPVNGSRIAVVLVAAGAVALAAARRGRRGLALLALVAAGLVAGQLIGQAEGAQSGAERLESGLADSSTRARFATWQAAGQAVADRPVFGAGPGRYLTATTPHRDLAFARFGGDTFFRDAHNLLVEYAVTTGLAGLATLVAWLLLAAHRARGPLAAFAIGVLALALLQPQFVGTTPLALLALGASGRGSPTVGPRGGRWWAVAAVPLVVVGLVAATRLVSGDYLVGEGRLAADPVMAERGDGLLPHWPEPANAIARLWVFESIEDRDDAKFERAMDWFRRAVGRDPHDPRWLNNLGAAEFSSGDFPAARRTLLRALEAAPYSPSAELGLARVALAEDQPEVALGHIASARKVSGDNDLTRQLTAEAEAKLATRI